MKQTYLAILFMFGFFHLSGQSLTGTNGLFKTPSAYVSPDGQSYIGVSFYPKSYYELYGSGDQFTGMPSFITLSLYDRVEFMFRYTHQLGQEVTPQTRYFPDRMFTLRYNALREGNTYPAFTIGLHDVSEALGGTSASPWFLSTYLVASKSFDLNGFRIQSSLGYAFDFIDSRRYQVFNGVFGGVEASLTQFPFLSAVMEYDSNYFNVALKATLLNHLHFSVGLLDFQGLSGFVTYRFNLSNR